MVAPCKCVIFIVGVLVNSFELICDWLVYYEISGLQQGLVFGPFDDSVVISLIVFSGIGCVIFMVDLILNVIDLSQEDCLPLWLLDAVNLISIWIEGIPQIALNIFIAGCREEAVSILQMAKAIAALVKVIAIIGIAIANHIYNNSKGKTYKTGYLLKIPIGIGLTIILIGSLGVFGLTQFFLNSENTIQFSSPTTFNGLEYDTDKYFNDAGVYMNFNAGQTGIVGMNSNEYLKLTDLKSITEGQSGTVVASVSYDSTNTALWIQSTTSSNVMSSEKSSCYSISALPFQTSTTCNTDLPLSSATTSLVIQFVYKSASVQVPLGDIYYNYAVTTYTAGGACISSTSIPSFSLSYFKVVTSTNVDPLVTLTGTNVEFYTSGSTIQDVTEAWKTGKFMCDPTGRSSPKMDTSITVPCLTWGQAVPP